MSSPSVSPRVSSKNGTQSKVLDSQNKEIIKLNNLLKKIKNDLSDKNGCIDLLQ